MAQSEMDREIERIKQMIMILARRKYILKSELLKMLPACRITGIAIDDIERIMASVIDDTIVYMDDTAESDSFRRCVELQKKLNGCGYDDVFQYLSVSNDVFIEGLILAYQNRQVLEDEEALHAQIGEMIFSDEFDVYIYYCYERVLWYELELRRNFNLSYVSLEEFLDFSNDLAQKANIDLNDAARIIEYGLLEYGAVVSETSDNVIKKIQNVELDEFLIPIPGEDEDQQINAKNKKKNK